MITPSRRERNLLFGVTYDPAREAELLAARPQLDVIEVKQIEPSFVRSILPVVQQFQAVSLHVQYLSVSGFPLTLNLANDVVHAQLRDPDVELLRYVLAEHAQGRLDQGPLLLTMECPRNLQGQLRAVHSLCRSI